MLDRIEILVTDDTEETPAAMSLRERTRDIAHRIAPGVEVATDHVDRGAAAEEFGATGLLAVRINGRLVDPRRLAEMPVASRVDSGRGFPSTPDWMIEAALVHALEPRHILFMCVANSARSQMAEGMARALAPAGVTISSAGSEPSEVRPEAVAALAELGIDIGGQRSKSVDVIDADTVQIVITLCQEEVCPTFLRPVPTLSWPMPDPAAVTGDAGERREAFVSVRDRIRTRLYVLFNG